MLGVRMHQRRPYAPCCQGSPGTAIAALSDSADQVYLPDSAEGSPKTQHHAHCVVTSGRHHLPMPRPAVH